MTSDVATTIFTSGVGVVALLSSDVGVLLRGKVPPIEVNPVISYTGGVLDGS